MADNNEYFWIMESKYFGELCQSKLHLLDVSVKLYSNRKALAVTEIATTIGLTNVRPLP